MPTIPEIAAFAGDMRDWRHHLHAHPETAFEETATSAFVADGSAVTVRRGVPCASARAAGNPPYLTVTRPRS